MKRFPLSIDLNGKRVFLVGSGEQIRDKEEKLLPFGAELVRLAAFAEADARQLPALVIVGDTPLEEAEKIAALCQNHRIPVNVVDVPRLCSFYFPALITRGDLTVGISTGGASPAAAGCVRRLLEQALPEETEAVLDWLTENTPYLRSRKLMKAAAAAAFAAGRPLTAQELAALE